MQIGPAKLGSYSIWGFSSLVFHFFLFHNPPDRERANSRISISGDPADW